MRGPSRRDGIWWAAGLLFVANGVRLRRRARRFAVLTPAAASGAASGIAGAGVPQGRSRAAGAAGPAPQVRSAAAGTAGTAGPAPQVPSAAAAAGAPGRGWSWLVAEGLVLPDATRREVEAWAAAGGLRVVDVVPGDLPCERALELVGRVDPVAYREELMRSHGTAGQAILVAADLVQRSGLPAGEGMSEVAMDDAARRLKAYAPTACGFVVVPGLAAVPGDPRRRKAFLRAREGPLWPAAVLLPAARMLFLAAGVVLCPPAGTVALLGWSLQPTVALAGSALRPRDRRSAPALRWLLAPVAWWRTLLGDWEPPPGTPGAGIDPESLRPVYDSLLAAGTEPFFEPRRADCPLCGADDLRVRVRLPDLMQHKPGRFTLEECAACGHVFQNPRLSPEGLAFYYRDFYDGLWGETMERVMASAVPVCRHRGALLDDLGEAPGSWLDVGCGHGHFGLVNGTDRPAVRYDGLDQSGGVVEAERRGWVGTGYRGLFTELAGDLEGSYDVVSMFHYLEHTRDPLAEIDAAARVLAPGGHLVIELPDPDSGYSRLCGPYWFPWFQPQHQHLMPMDVLVGALERRGWEVRYRARRKEGFNPMALTAMAMAVQRWAPAVTQYPWLPRRSPLRYVRRAVGYAVIGVLAPLALGLDAALYASKGAQWRASAYEVVARVAPESRGRSVRSGGS